MSELTLQQKEILETVYQEQWASLRDVQFNSRHSYDALKDHLPMLDEMGYLDSREVKQGKLEYRVALGVVPAVMAMRASLR